MRAASSIILHGLVSRRGTSKGQATKGLTSISLQNGISSYTMLKYIC